MTIEAFLATAWHDHGDRPQEVADRLAASFDLVETPEHVAPFVRLLAHVLGEHLGQWQRGSDLLDGLRRDRPAAASATAARPIAVAQAMLRWCDERSDALAALSREDRIAALAGAASALAEREPIERAMTAYSEALRDAPAAAPLAAHTVRTLAASGNNLAVALERRRGRTAAQTHAMRIAAESALRYWKEGGTWLEEERAEYRLARTLLEAGEPEAAVRSAERCAALCDAHDAPAFERFFAHAIVAIAQRAAGDAAMYATHRQRALEWHERLTDDEKHWCEADRRELAP